MSGCSSSHRGGALAPHTSCPTGLALQPLGSTPTHWVHVRGALGILSLMASQPWMNLANLSVAAAMDLLMLV